VWLALDRAERDKNEKKRLQGEPSDRAATVRILRDKLATLSPSQT
jgi:hypothetical protein